MDDSPRHTFKTMENKTAFDLNLAIQHWREGLAQSAAFRNENLDELESHLRDSIERLQSPGLSGEEAFLIATRRVGNAQRLEQEYGKMNGTGIWLDRCLWVLVAVQLWSLVANTSTLVVGLMFPLCGWLNKFLPFSGIPKIGEDWIQTVSVLMFSPIILALIAVLIGRFLLWPKRLGSGLIQNLLCHPGRLALRLFLLCAVFNIVAAFAMQTWYLPGLYHHAYSPGLAPQVLSRLFPAMLWATLTFFIARKRIRVIAT